MTKRHFRFLHNANAVICSLGIDVGHFAQFLKGSPKYLKDLLVYKSLNEHNLSFQIDIRNLRPMLHDFNSEAGRASGQYFHQDLWAARKIWKARPSRHVDLGSRIDGFIAHLLVFMPVDVIDIRPIRSAVPGLNFVQADATDLSALSTASVESLSSLHAVEHFGLGRYGDPVDPSACFRVMRSMTRVLKRGGRLYFSVPIGRERLQFNSQRVFSPRTILRCFEELECHSFAAIADDGIFHCSPRVEDFESARNACGLFEFIKPS